MLEVIFLLILACIWIIFAVVQDIKTKEIANWLNFSLIIFALGFRFFYSFFGGAGFAFFYQGLIGICIFFLIGNLLYYGRMFAGGDAKLMIALGAILPFSIDFFINLKIYLIFLFLFFLVGALYGVFWSLFLVIKNFDNFKKEFKIIFKKYKKISLISSFIGIIFLAVGFLNYFSFILGIFFFIFPYFYFYAKAIDEACMIKSVSPKNLIEGDWLYNKVKIGKKEVVAKWEGLGKKDIDLLIKRGKNVQIRTGIFFSPVFLISFILLLVVYFKVFF